MLHFVYLLECRDKTLYCGYTGDLERRVRLHKAGKGAKYTRGRLPIRLVYHEAFGSKTPALKREAGIKGLSAEKKRELFE